jgi:hypothetical protein
LQSPCLFLSIHLSVCPSVHTFITDISASTRRNGFIFDLWLWHGDLYHVSLFQAYRTSTSCLPRDLEIFIFAVIKTFVTDISASTRRNDFIFDMWLWHGDLYRVSPFQVYCTSTSCLPCELEFLFVSTCSLVHHIVFFIGIVLLIFSFLSRILSTIVCLICHFSFGLLFFL